MTKQELKKARKSLNLTQKALAEKLGVGIKTIEAWEYGKNPIPKPIEKLIKIMKKELEK